jgi:hypothetical protein
MRARLAARPKVTAAALFAVMAILFVSPGLMPGHTLSNSDSFWFKAPWSSSKPASLKSPSNPTFDDAPAVLQPFVRYTIRDLPSIPLWNPNIMTGRPFEANAQSAIFSPFSIPSYILPFFTSLGWIAALKLWTAGFGMFLLGRALGMRFAGAMMAGVIYGFNLWEVVWISYPHASVWALIPWMMLFCERAIRRPDVRGAAPLAIAVALQFLCGHPESSFHAVFATSVFFLVRMVARRGNWWRPLLAFAGAMALGTGLAALTLIPFIELLLRSADIHQRAGSAALAIPSRHLLIEGLLPDWAGRATQVQTTSTFELARAWYGGALSVMLATIALILRPSRGRFLIAAMAIALMMVVVAWGPVFTIVVHLPIFSSGHNLRLAVLALLCLALLAGFGLDDLLARVGSLRRRQVALGSAVLIFVAPLAWAVVLGKTSWGTALHGLDVAWGFVHPDIHWPSLPDVVRSSALWIWLGVAGGGLIVVALATLARRRVGAGALAVVAVALVYGDLARAGVGYTPAIRTSIATQPVTPAIDLLRSAGTARFVATGDIPQDALPMNYGLYESRGYDLPIDDRFDHLWRTTLSPEYPSQAGPFLAAIPLSLPKVTPDRLRVLGVMGTRYVVQPPTDPPLRAPELRLVRNGPDLRVYRNLDEQPRAAVVGSQTVVKGGAAALAAVVAPGFRIDGAAVTEHAIPGLPTAARAPAPASNGSARITGEQDDSITVDATAKHPGMLVLSDAWYPGWKATVDGRPATVSRVDYVFRGVKIGAGRHRIAFTFQPLSWRIGWIVSLVCLLGLTAALAVPSVRGRRRARGAAGAQPISAAP